MTGVRYAFPATSLSFLHVKAALEQGFYRQQGLDVEMILTAAGVTTAAQLSGEVDYTAVYPTALHSAAQGAPLRIVSTVLSAPLFVLMAQPGITSVRDLKGQSVGITTRGGAVEKTTRDLLRAVDVDPDRDVTLLPAGAQTPVLVESLVSGRVQAAALSAPWYVRARSQGMVPLVKATEVIREPQNGLVVTADRLVQQRDQVRRVLQAELTAVRFLRESRAAAVALSREWLSISQEEAEEAYDLMRPVLNADGQVDVAGLERYVATEQAAGTLPASFRVEQVVDTTLAPEAARGLGA